jgi:crotonobetainyl-CoA:carnitine CoA-transferase CaiB-like acyl-CoA transferase
VTPGLLTGLRVLDLADQSGALAGRLLAGLGADVVLLEPPGGSALRTIPPLLENVRTPERSLFFWFYAAGKRSVVCDPATADGAALLDDLAGRADVLIDTGPPGATVAVRARHPRLIVASITPFGQSGPYRDWHASDLVAQAVGGMLAVSGHADGPPLHSLGLQAYHQAGVFAAIGIMAALRSREQTGRGQHIDVSLQAAVAGSLEHVAGLFHQSGLVARRQGTLHWTRFFRLGRCKDGWIMHCTLGDWTSLIEWVKADGFGAEIDDPALEEPMARQKQAERIFPVLDAWAARYTVAELYEGAQLRRIPYAAVHAPEALLADPHLAERRFFVPVEHPDLGRTVRFPGVPFRIDDLHWHITAPPRLDADREAVVGSWVAREPARPRPSGSPADPPLTGVRVLDFTWVVAGPVATRILADLGADVIKVERRNAVDFGDRRGGLSGTLMRGKRSVVLNLGDPRGVALARRLALASDVVIDNFSARVMSNLGLDHATLRTARPDLICARMTGYGLTGPDRDKVSYGPTLQALTGYTLLMGEPGRPPAGFGYSYSDLAAGNFGALAVLLALWHRRRTGTGVSIDLAQQEAVASLLGPLLLQRAVAGGVSTAVGNASQEAPGAPHGVYPCAGDDRWIAITVFGDDDWARFVRAADGPPWGRDPRFATHDGRYAHAAELDRHIAAWTRTLEADVAMERLQAAGLAAGRVANAAELCAGDPQLAARGHFVDVPTPEGTTVRLDGPAFLLSETPAAVRGPGPLLGEHSDAVLAEVLGLDREEIAALHAEGVVAGPTQLAPAPAAPLSSPS